ncbi:MAG: hypothetical protein P1S60_10650, partial [Anaerolineae bacterium]|nr:hypothetical protein [Anaerolineae bacterium]
IPMRGRIPMRDLSVTLADSVLAVPGFSSIPWVTLSMRHIQGMTPPLQLFLQIWISKDWCYNNRYCPP